MPESFIPPVAVDGDGHAGLNGAGLDAGDDRHGRAALLLAESILHALVDKRLLTTGEAIEIVDIARDVEIGEAADGDGRAPPSLLDPITRSLRGGLAG